MSGLKWVIVSAFILAILIVLEGFHITNGLAIVIPFIEWLTKYMLPWIGLYWFVRFVRALEDKK